MNTALKIAVVLGAVDNLTAAVSAAVNNSSKKLTEFAQKQQRFTAESAKGFAMMGVGKSIADSMQAPITAYADLEKEQLALKSTFLKAGGSFDAEQFGRITDEATRLGNMLPGTTADFIKLFRTMKENGTDAETILNGTGEAAAFLAVQLQLPMDVAGQMAARLRQNFNLKGSDMSEFMDLLARIKQVGPDATEITYAFNKSSGAINAFGLTGMANVKAMGAIYAQLVAAGGGFTGETAGTSMQSVLFEMLDPKKMAAMQNAAAQYGKTLDFFDTTGKFAGMDNFIFQLDKLRELGESDKFNVLSAIAGPQGKDMSLLLSLTNAGTKGFNDMNRKLAEQADLQTKVGTQLTGLAAIWEATSGTFTNTLAAIGEVWGPEIKKVTEAMGSFSVKVIEFVKEHPTITKAATAVVGLAAGGLMLAGAIKAIAAGLAFLELPALLGAIEFGAFAIGYYFKFTIIPAIEAAGTAFGGLATSIGAVALEIGFVVAGLYMMYKLLPKAEKLYDQMKLTGSSSHVDRQAPGGSEWWQLGKMVAGGGNGWSEEENKAFKEKYSLSKANDSSTVVHSAPTININGNMDANATEQMRNALKDNANYIYELFNRRSNDANRVSLGTE